MRDKNIKISVYSKVLSLLLAIIVSSTAIIGTVAYGISSKSLKASVSRHLGALSSELANTIDSMNEKEFALIEGLAKLDIICEEEVTLEEKSKVLTAVRKRLGSRYENLAFYSKNGDAMLADGTVRNFKGDVYLEAALRGERFISEPAFTAVTGKVMQNYTVPVYGKNNTPIGAIVLILNGNGILEIIKNIDMGGGIHPSVIHRTKQITIANANEGTDENSNDEELDTTQGLGLILQHIFDGKEGQEDFIDPTIGLHMIVSYKGIPKTEWSIFAVAPYDFYFGSLKQMRFVIIMIIVITVILSIIISAFIVRFIVKPLNTVKSSIETIASGNADLTQRIPNTSRDEIGDVVKGFNSFVEKLQGIVRNLQKSKENLVVVDNGLQESTQDATASITEIIANIESVNGQILNQVDAVDETAGAVNQISSNISSLERMIESQAASVTEASAAVEEMIGNINSVNNSVGKMISSFKTLQNHSNDGFTTQNNANEKIMRIEEQSKMLQDANTAIANIAEQTNLLAMNAAIEAAHAGEAGKGFAVVADEIRKLSETSTDQSKTIGSELQKIQTTIQEVVDASNETNTVFTAIAQSISETSQIIEQIKGAMEEQQIGSKQIIEALKSMNDSTSEVHSASNEMAEGNKHILSQIQKLQQATDTIKDSIQEMHIGADRINATGAALSVISSRVADNIKQIGSEIDLFKV